MSYARTLLQPADVQIARYYYNNRDRLVSSSTPARRPKSGQRKTGRSEWMRGQARKDLMKLGEFAEYDLSVVSRRTVPDPHRTTAMEANELRLWDKCAACHRELGTIAYRYYLTKRIERYETRAYLDPNSDDETGSFVALRRLIAILLQERMMLDMEEAELKAVGFDGMFIALGRGVRVTGFKEEMGWSTEGELRAYREANDKTARSEAGSSEGLPVGDPNE
ncbi:unnamed protein product [Peniophora sp. CBMAI 1063]|nr:unnamed protein product [Peniophora sp. CBMAI 1063]